MICHDGRTHFILILHASSEDILLLANYSQVAGEILCVQKQLPEVGQPLSDLLVFGYRLHHLLTDGLA
jgi:hypothetical protein